MRTTVTIDDHLLARAKDRARADGLTLGLLVEKALVQLLASPTGRKVPELPVFGGGGHLMPGVDGTSNASMYAAADLDEDEATARAMRR